MLKKTVFCFLACALSVGLLWPGAGAQSAAAGDDAPQLLEPSEGEIADNGCETNRDNPIEWEFSWTPVPGARKYQIMVRGLNAPVPVINEVTRETTFRSARKAYIIPRHKDWVWKVRARLDGKWGPWSEEGLFEVEPVNTDCAAQ
jgi:hypothetical protein